MKRERAREREREKLIQINSQDKTPSCQNMMYDLQMKSTYALLHTKQQQQQQQATTTQVWLELHSLTYFSIIPQLDGTSMRNRQDMWRQRNDPIRLRTN
jgi:hypothetical protein